MRLTLAYTLALTLRFHKHGLLARPGPRPNLIPIRAIGSLSQGGLHQLFLGFHTVSTLFHYSDLVYESSVVIYLKALHIILQLHVQPISKLLNLDPFMISYPL